MAQEEMSLINLKVSHLKQENEAQRGTITELKRRMSVYKVILTELIHGSFLDNQSDFESIVRMNKMIGDLLVIKKYSKWIYSTRTGGNVERSYFVFKINKKCQDEFDQNEMIVLNDRNSM